MKLHLTNFISDITMTLIKSCDNDLIGRDETKEYESLNISIGSPIFFRWAKKFPISSDISISIGSSLRDCYGY